MLCRQMLTGSEIYPVDSNLNLDQNLQLGVYIFVSTLTNFESIRILNPKRISRQKSVSSLSSVGRAFDCFSRVYEVAP